MNKTFKHRQTKCRFDYKEIDNSPFPGFNYEICTGSGNRRYAKILKTVAHIVTDEDINGQPVVESWPIQHITS